MIVLIVITALGAALAIWACAVRSGEIARQEEQEHPCGLCVRWEECNGVDEECPRRKAHGN